MSETIIQIIKPGFVLEIGAPGPQGPAGSGGGTGSYNNLTDVPAEFPPAPHSHEQADVNGLVEALADKADAVTVDAQFAAVDADIATKTTSAEAAAAAPVQSVSGRTGNVTLAKADVGLGNVDNTSDSSKPISSATSAALASKSDVGHTHAISDTTGLQSALNGKSDTSHTHSNATTGAAGFLSAADKTKLDGIAAGATAVSLAHAEVEIDFGSNPVKEKKFTITAASCLSTSRVFAVESGNPATGRGIDDSLWDQLMMTAKPTSGQFTLSVRAIPGPVMGKRKVFYTINN